MELDHIYCGDNVKVLAGFPDACIDLTVTSPPYDKLRTYNGYSWDFNALAPELYRVTKLGGVVVWVVGDATVNGSETGTSFRQALYLKEKGFNLHDTMIYRKMNYIPLTHRRYEQEWEYMFVFSKGSPAAFNPITEKSNGAGKKYNLIRKGYGFKEGAFRRGDRDVTTKDAKQHGNIFEYPCGNSGINHPAPFPEDLARDHILSWSNPGDLVLDPFVGSGTTAKMAKEFGRHWIGIDISAEYCKLAERRVAGANVPLFVDA